MPVSPALSGTFDVAIIGGGVIGCAIAHRLSRSQVSVVLVEKEADVGFGTSKANSGIIHGGHHSPADTLKGQLEWEGNQLWGPLADQLSISFDRVGDLTVAFEDHEMETLGKLLQNSRQRGIGGVQLWSQAQLRQAEPNVNSDAIGAVFGPTTGVINPYEACFALIADAVFNGVTLVLNAPVTSIHDDQNGFVLNTPSGDISAHNVVNAAGLGAARVAEMARARTFTLHPRKGEEYLLDKRLRGLVKHVVFPCPTPTSKGILVIPTFDGTLMVGPTADDIIDPEDITTTTDGSARVFAAVQRLVPGISARDCIAEFAGVRAVSDTGDFVIERTIPGFINVAGIQSPGLTAAPAIARLVGELLVEGGLGLEPKASVVAVTRPPVAMRDRDRASQAAAASSDPTYGRVVCRCELVTEGEVVDAIERGGQTLDGIKFRTRAGMGRCQGGFCTWRVMELLSRELGIPVSGVTKRGGGSWLVLDRQDVTR